jgi:hypothetical protein
MVDSSKSTSAYKILIGLRNKITHLNGIITSEGIDKLKDKLGSVCTLIKTHHYMEGQKYGHLASIILQEKIQDCHQQQRLDPRGTGQPRRLFSSHPWHGQHGSATQTVHCQAQGPPIQW